MEVSIVYQDRNYATVQFVPLPDGQTVLFGNGSRADYPVGGPEIAPIHFAIKNDGKKVVVRHMAESKAPLLVNDRETKECVLQDGDVVFVGTTQVGIQIKGLAESDDADSDHEPELVLDPQELPTGLIEWNDPGGEVEQPKILERLLDRYSPILIANFRLAEIPFPAWLSEQTDLLEGTSEEFEQNNSLHLLEAGDMPGENLPDEPELHDQARVEELIRLYESLSTKDGAVLMFGDSSKDDLFDAIQYHRGFLCNPSGLKLFLGQGSKDLAKKLVSATSAVLFCGANTADWTLYSNPELVSTAEDMGLAGEPAAV